MALSNTATPTYYGQFRDAVMRGEIPVNREISLEMNRIDALIANPNIYYDDQAVEGFIRFCEGEMTLTDGNDLHLLFTFKLWAEQIFGWYYFVERSVYVPSEVITAATTRSDDQDSFDQEVLSHRGSRWSQVDVRCSHSGVLHHGRYVDHASDHHGSDHEAGRRGDVADSHGHYSCSRSAVQVPHRGLAAEHHGQSHAAAEAGGHQEGCRELPDRISPGDPTDGHQQASGSSYQDRHHRRVAVR
jgi:hypothetical protein